MWMDSDPHLPFPPGLHRVLDGRNVRRDIVMVTRWRIHRHNLIHCRAGMPHNGVGDLAFDVAIEDQVVPILIGICPGCVGAEPVVTTIASRAASVAQAMIGRTNARLPKAILVQEKGQRIDRINAVLYSEIVERLTSPSRR